MIDQDTIEKIRARADIAEVVGMFVKLRKQGSSYRGLCPFHDDKHPSFSVSPARGVFKCFSCNEGGDVFSFLMKHESFGFDEAARWLADHFDIEIREEETDGQQDRRRALRERFFAANERAAVHYAVRLESDEKAKEYLHSRGIGTGIATKFGLGYSLPDPMDLIHTFRAAGLNDSEAELAGLVFPGNGKDRLCGRLIFPIRTLSGKIVAFGGRLLQADENKAKYINSAESEFYQKRSELYGLCEGKKAIVKAGNCFLVEGYTDVLRLHEAGTEAVVAPLGTAFTAEQALKLRRFTERVTILTDGDRAGLNAAYKQLEVLLSAGLHVCFIPLPDGADPDDFFRDKAGAEVAGYLENESRDALLFFSGLIWQKADADPHKKAKAIGEMVRLLHLIPDRVKRLFYMRELRKITGLPDIRMLDPESYQAEKPVARKFSELYETMDEQIERRLISWLIYAGNQPLLIRMECDDVVWQTTVYAFVETVMKDEELQFSNPVYQRIMDACANLIADPAIIPEHHFIHHPDKVIATLSADLITRFEPDPDSDTENQLRQLLLLFCSSKIEKQISHSAKECNFEAMDVLRERWVGAERQGC